jgi:hypothetical protein
MVHLNYNNLDAATQERLLLKSKQEIEQRFGYDLNKYAIQNGLTYNQVLEEEAIRNLYNYSFTFTI